MDRLIDEVGQEPPWTMMFVRDMVICSKVLKGVWRGGGSNWAGTYRYLNFPSVFFFLLAFRVIGRTSRVILQISMRN